jgi:DNA-directed RNA polymerase alpha subunit
MAPRGQFSMARDTCKASVRISMAHGQNFSLIPMLDPTQHLSDSVELQHVRLPTRIRNVLALHGFRTIGDVRLASDKTLLSLPDLGPKSVAQLRAGFGLDSKP